MSQTTRLVSLAAAAAIGFAGSALAESDADREAKAVGEMAEQMDEAAGATQEVADTVVDGVNAVNDAKDAGMASSEEAEAADRAAEATSSMAADMMEGKIIMDEAAKEAKSEANLEDMRELMDKE